MQFDLTIGTIYDLTMLMCLNYYGSFLYVGIQSAHQVCSNCKCGDGVSSKDSFSHLITLCKGASVV